MGKSPVEEHYDLTAHTEWERLDRHRTEFAVTLRALEAHLPGSPHKILDIGGGPGRYAIALAARKHHVTLADISSRSLKVALQKASEAGVTLADTVHADALDLRPVESGSFDAVLLMGPLYHLLEESERRQAVLEAVRVLRPGGLLFAAFVTRFAPFRDAASRNTAWYVNANDYAARMLATGIHDRGKEFVNAYFAHPDEVLPLMEKCGLRQAALLGCEGVVSGHEAEVNKLEGRAWEMWVELNYRLGHEPSLFGGSDHLLYIGRKPA